MSWFDASTLATIAKSALKEAQRTIDKALDIKEEDVSAVPINTPTDVSPKESCDTKNESTPVIPDNLQTNLYESFPELGDQSKKQDFVFVDDEGSLDASVETLTASDVSPQQNDQGNWQSESSFVIPSDPEKIGYVDSTGMTDIDLNSPEVLPIAEPEPSKKSAKVTTATATTVSDSKNVSSESVEFINCSAECTSPESDVLSNEYNNSSDSTEAKQTSESVEVLVESPSSLEIISSESGEDKNQDEFSVLGFPLTEEKMSTQPTQMFMANEIDDRKHDLLSKKTIKKYYSKKILEALKVTDETDSTEILSLLKGISEMTEILDFRESELVELNRKYAELQDANTDLKHQLNLTLNNKQVESVNVSEVTEEYTQRLSALEKKFQQAIREKDDLRKQLEHFRTETSTRITKSELDTLISEKDQTIKELREEGEKLSRQQLQHSNIIKKLRAKEKENEYTTKNLRETIEELHSETDRLKRSLDAKEEVERAQIEAIHQLTAKNITAESKIAKLESQLEDLKEKYDAAKKSFEEARKEILDKSKTNSEISATERLLESLQSEKRMTESQNATIMNQLEDLRSKVRESELQCVRKEQTWRKESNDLLRRLQEAESRNEELSQSILEASKPFVRQLESLQTALSMKIANSEKSEQELILKLNQLQRKLDAALNSEKTAKEKCTELKLTITKLETELQTLHRQNDTLKAHIERLNGEKLLAEQELQSIADGLREELRLEKLKNEDILENIAKMDSRENSLSEECRSQAEEMKHEESIGVRTPPSYSGNMLEIQMLQSHLKQRESDVHQLQWELSRREQERSLLNVEISKLLTRIDDLENKLAEYDTLKEKFNEVSQQYDTLCQLYGEKVEENEELKLDLLDVKEAYKIQIDDLLKQQKQNS